MELTYIALAYAVFTLLSCILCTSSFVAGILAKSIQARPDSEKIMAPNDLRLVLIICKITFFISSGASGFLLCLGAGIGIFYALGLLS